MENTNQAHFQVGPIQTQVDVTEQEVQSQIQDNNQTQEQSQKPQRTRCEVWTRVMGYHRPVSHFNTGKKAEHYGRKHFIETIAANKVFTEQYSEA